MKKVFLILLVAMLANYVSAASIPTDTIHLLSAKKYLLKSNRQMGGEIICITGVVLLSGVRAANFPESNDVATTGTSVVPVTAKGVHEKSNGNLNTGNGLFTNGIAAIFTGEPLFVVSSKNRKRALSVSTTEQVIKKMQRNSISKVSIPSIKLTIHL